MYQQQLQQEREQATSGLEVDVMADSKKYDGSIWEHSLRKLTTATEAVENPLYSDGIAITNYTISGNTVQNGTPTPDSPVMPEGCGDLEATGEHAGQYKIPISSGGVTTNIYLGSTQTTRQIKKLVLTGDEEWILQSINSYGIANLWTRLPVNYINAQLGLSSHLTRQTTLIANTETEGFHLASGDLLYIRINATSVSTANELKAYLAAQYAAGTPVTVWYVPATPETGIVNEPLMKIGEYADTVSNAASIPTTGGANSITVDTTV